MKLTMAPAFLRRWSTIATGVLVCAIVANLVWPRPHPPGLPEPVAEQLERHSLATAADTVNIDRLERVAADAERNERVEKTRARSPTPDLSRLLPESEPRLEIELSNGALAANGLRARWLDSALVLADLRASTLDSALTISQTRASRADSVLKVVVEVANSRDPPCRLLWILRCPSRIHVMLGTALGTAIGVAALLRLASRHLP